MTTRHDTVNHAAQATPSVIALAVAWLDVPIETWMTRAGLTFLVLQIAYLLWKWTHEYRDRRRRNRSSQ
jgi:hypothetical protein